jgi:hypothetical protein
MDYLCNILSEKYYLHITLHRYIHTTTKLHNTTENI